MRVRVDSRRVIKVGADERVERVMEAPPMPSGRPVVHPQETVVPIVLPRNMGRETVVKIVLRFEDP